MNKEHHEHYRLYLETNRSFVAEKFQELFKVELQEEDPRINHINQNKLEKLVREVLSFEGNPELQRFYAELSSNIAKFC
ncbi:MAG: hypothetical protein JST59_01540 [Actinobacteria bacterium]|nr:hypothetical protein [Actinomycetota bacterium]